MFYPKRISTDTTLPISNHTNNTVASDFEYAWVTLIVPGNIDVVVTDSQGKKTGFNPLTGMAYSQIPNSSYIAETPPGVKIGSGIDIKRFEVKLDDSYSYHVEFFGKPGSSFYYDYLMTSNVPEKYSAREVKKDLIFDDKGIQTVDFVYEFVSY